MMQPMEAVVLASASPRRLALMRQAGIPVIQIPVDVDESMPSESSLEEARAVTEILARRKVERLLADHPVHGDSWVLGADTVVFCGSRLLGKPRNVSEAGEFLDLLSGKTHQVITGVALRGRKTGRICSASELTEVTFRPLTEEDLSWYLSSGEWSDAAG
ncbi:MAG: Maf-like protein, partial [Spirochaetales bacterium]